MNKKLRLISCLIAGIMSSGAYADTTENDDNKKNQKSTLKTIYNGNTNKSVNLDSSQLLTDTSDTNPSSSLTPQSIQSSSMTFKGLGVGNGILSYSRNLYTTKANYGKTTFSLDLVFNQNAPATYNGGFSGTENDISGSNQHPFGVAAYMPNFVDNIIGNFYGDASSSSTVNTADTISPRPLHTYKTPLYLDPIENSYAIWGYSLPAMYIQSDRPSKYYGDDHYHTMNLSLGGVTYSFIVQADLGVENGDDPKAVNGEFMQSFLKQVLVDNKPIPVLTKSGEKLVFEPIYTVDEDAVEGVGEISVTTPDGIKYFFEFGKYMSGGVVNKYNPYAEGDGHGTRLPGVFIFNIKRIIEPNGSSLYFSYERSVTSAITSMTVTDDSKIVICKIENGGWDSTKINSLANNDYKNIYTTISGRLNGKLIPLFKLYYNGKNGENIANNTVVEKASNKVSAISETASLIVPRISTIEDLLNSNNTEEFTYTTHTGTSNPNGPGNVTQLTQIQQNKLVNNKLTSNTVTINYTRVVQEVRDAGGNIFNSYNYLVSDLNFYNTEFNNHQTPITHINYNYFPNGEDNPSIIMPFGKHEEKVCIAPGYYNNCNKYGYKLEDTKFYGSGFNAWLENLFYKQNQDDYSFEHNTGMNTLEYSIVKTITDYDNFGLEDSVLYETSTYDALQRLKSKDTAILLLGNSMAEPIPMSSMSYTYDIDISNVGSGADFKYQSFDSLPEYYKKPATITKKTYNKVINGTVSVLSNPIVKTEKNTYDEAGNITDTKIYAQHITGKDTFSNDGLILHKTYSYLPASETYPMHYERFVNEATTYNNDSSEFITKKYNYSTVSNNSIINFFDSGEKPVENYLVVKNYQVSSRTKTGDSPTFPVISNFNYSSGSTNNLVKQGLLSSTVENIKENPYSPALETTIASKISLLSDGEIQVSSTTSSIQNNNTFIANGNTKTMDETSLLLQETSPAGQITSYNYDDHGRVIEITYFTGTDKEQSVKKSYNETANLALDSSAITSTSTTDVYGNKIIKLFDWRSKLIATYKQDSGQTAPLKISSNKYNDFGQLSESTSYVTGTPVTIKYYYNTLHQLVAKVPEIGLASGTITDSLNGNAITFNYEPSESDNTIIEKIYGNVTITQTNILTGKLNFSVTISPEIANQYLKYIYLSETQENLGSNSITIANTPNIFYQTISNSNGEQIQPAKTLRFLNSLYEALTSKVDGVNFINLTKYKYDEWNRLSSVETTFKNNDNIVTHTKEYSYTDDNSQATVKEANGNIITKDLNNLGKVVKTTLNVDGKTTIIGETEYNALGLPISSTSINGENKTTFDYDQYWRLSSSTNVNGITTTLERDPVLGKVIKSTTGDFVNEYSYDDYGRLISIIDQDGNKIENTYLDNGLLDTNSTTYANDKTYTWSYKYNEFDQITSLFNPFLKNNDGSFGLNINFEKDKYGRLIGQSYGTIGDNSTGFKNTITYGNSLFPSLATSIVTESSEKSIANTTIDYTYNDLGQLINKSFQTTNMTYPNTIDYTYDVNGMLIGKKTNSQYTVIPTTIDYKYDNYGRLITFDQSVLSGADTVLPSISDYLGNALAIQTYKYDNYNNIVEMSSTSVDSQGAYNTPSVRTYNYNNEDNPFRLTSVSNSVNGVETTGALKYDLLGNVIENYDGTTLTYNDFNRVATIKRPSQSKAETYQYGFGKIIHEYSPLTDTTNTTYYNGSTVVARGSNIGGADENTYVNTPYGLQINLGSSSSSQKIFFEDQGSINGIYSDESSQVSLLKYSGYTPFGVESQIVNNNHSGYPKNIQNEKMNTVYGYRGELSDSNTGYQLLGNGTRLYDPVIGRFLQSDPAKSGLNWYTYAGNNPIMSDDPSGLMTTIYNGPHKSDSLYKLGAGTQFKQKLVDESARGNPYAEAFFNGYYSSLGFGVLNAVEAGMNKNWGMMAIDITTTVLAVASFGSDGIAFALIPIAVASFASTVGQTTYDLIEGHDRAAADEALTFEGNMVGSTYFLVAGAASRVSDIAETAEVSNAQAPDDGAGEASGSGERSGEEGSNRQGNRYGDPRYKPSRTIRNYYEKISSFADELYKRLERQYIELVSGDFDIDSYEANTFGLTEHFEMSPIFNRAGELSAGEWLDEVEDFFDEDGKILEQYKDSPGYRRGIKAIRDEYSIPENIPDIQVAVFGEYLFTQTDPLSEDTFMTMEQEDGYLDYVLDNYDAFQADSYLRYASNGAREHTKILVRLNLTALR